MPLHLEIVTAERLVLSDAAILGRRIDLINVVRENQSLSRDDFEM